MPSFSQLGKVINGTGPIEDDDDDDGDEEDDDVRPMNVPPRMSMGMGMGMNRNVPFPSAVSQMGLQGQWNPSTGAQQPFANPLGSLSMQDLLSAGAGAGVGMGGGMNMPGGMNMNMNMNMGGMGPGVGMVDPRMFVAHQQAMMIAKQTYQLAVAQQAMREAGDEWERGSAVSGWGGGANRSSMASSSVLGMGMNMGMNMNPNHFGLPPAAWPTGGGGSAARSMYAGSVYAPSEAGGGGGMGWSTTHSVYGESFGSPRDRSSRGFRQSQGQQQQHGHGQGGGGASGAPKREGARQRTRTAPSSGAGQQARASAAAAAAGGAKRRPDVPGPGLVGVVSPPSSWKGRS
jgi:serine/arginine repetitive matrix protein 2